MKIKKIVDLSLPLDNNLPVFPGDPEPNIRPATTIEKHGYNTAYLDIGSHTGTHVDAPFHIRGEGKTIERLPLENFIGEGVLIPATHKDHGEAITLEDAAPYLNKLGPGKVALIHTGWTRYLGEDEYFNHPYLDIEVVVKMLDLGVRTFLIDALNVDPPTGEEFPAHEAITAVNGIIGENFTNFDQITFDNPLIIALPLKVTNGDGSPVRAIAIDC
ncbi:MAG TPA: cyclase family protein [Bacillus bacterium]|uniref:Cyclase n=1 Tax=Siminovitchia fordii TaxID=254759 RepID=A0ABQ4K3P6_9BACI|nr:cyclase family protein [Siminovitchia fordii]GIN19772.1 cyclase [Siminovitchia fordii]HBZ10864.1 cyclase family protein [Bacillus sp. (in: firmicutes)]